MAGLGPPLFLLRPTDSEPVAFTSDAEAINRVRGTLEAVASSGRLRDPCSVQRAIDATQRLNLQQNVPTIRMTARLDHDRTVPAADAIVETL